MCGEKSAALTALFCTGGSPPRVRRKERRRRGEGVADGITPACAGKSRRKRRGRYIKRDHPRVCGEKSLAKAISKPDWGSPPRVRGKVDEHTEPLKAVRITPACAGKSAHQSDEKSERQDHPRVCGEKHCGGACEWRHVGSPPRVRGKVLLLRQMIKQRGITPACAGKRSIQSGDFTPSRDHPRVCGEKTKESLKK